MSISIIIPVYNVASYIEDCISSVMRQTYKGVMECLLVDDCGTDDSIAISERLIANYEGPIRFEIIRHERNKGLSAARNTGIQHAIGDYIFFLDSDDQISDNCIELLMEKVVRDPSVDLVQGNVKTLPVDEIDNLTVKVNRSYVTTNQEVRSCFYETRQMNVAAWNKVVKRSFILENRLFFMEGVLFEDALWTFLLLKYVRNACFVSDTTYFYQRRANSIVTGADDQCKADSFMAIYHEIITHLTSGFEQQEYNYYAVPFSYFYARYSKLCANFSDVFTIWWNAKEYGSWYCRLRLATGYILAKIKYGWLFFTLLSRLKHPSYISYDVYRMLKSSKRHQIM